MPEWLKGWLGVLEQFRHKTLESKKLVAAKPPGFEIIPAGVGCPWVA